jgi:hypothetical protein
MRCPTEPIRPSFLISMWMKRRFQLADAPLCSKIGGAHWQMESAAGDARVAPDFGWSVKGFERKGLDGRFWHISTFLRRRDDVGDWGMSGPSTEDQ